MKVNVKITHVLEPRKGVNAQTGKSWCFQPIRVEWTEQGTRKSDGSLYTIPHSLVVDLTGASAENFNLPVGATITIDLKHEASEYKGRFYNNIRSNYCTLCGSI